MMDGSIVKFSGEGERGGGTSFGSSNRRRLWLSYGDDGSERCSGAYLGGARSAGIKSSSRSAPGRDKMDGAGECGNCDVSSEASSSGREEHERNDGDDGESKVSPSKSDS